MGGTVALHEMIDSASYMAHGYCLLWKPWLVALHAGSDFLIFASYSAIPVAIWIFVSKRPNIELKGLARMFAAFILWCGLTHIVNLVTLWWPIYEFQGLVKLITAGISLTTAVAIFPLISHALAIPSPNELQIANADLAREVAAHKLTLDKLEQARARLEQRVQERTKDLGEATERFRSLFEHAPVAMLMADRNGAVRLMNASAERLLGYRRDGVVAGSVDVLLPEAHRREHGRLMAAFHAAPAARLMGMGRELFGRRQDGKEIPVEIGLNPLKVEGETFVVASILDISARREAEKRMQFVMRELTHRSKNLLAVIQSIARQAARHSQSIEEFHRDFADRLGGLAKSHDLLVARDWQGAEITDLVHSQLAYLGPVETERVEVDGEPMLLAPQAAQNLGLALHELATNSVKHGALSPTSGKVRIAWSTEQAGNEERRLRFVWREEGGAAVVPPERMGFGHLVLEDVVPGMLGGTGTLAFEPDGVAWTLDVPLRAVLNEARPVHAEAARA